MAAYILFVGLTEFFPLHHEIWNLEIYITLVISTICYGFFFSTMLLSWNIGSYYFGTNEEAGDYQSIHLFATGLRGTAAPIMGIALYELLGFSMTFGAAILSLLLGVYILNWSYKKRLVSKI